MRGSNFKQAWDLATWYARNYEAGSDIAAQYNSYGDDRFIERAAKRRTPKPRSEFFKQALSRITKAVDTKADDLLDFSFRSM